MLFGSSAGVTPERMEAARRYFNAHFLSEDREAAILVHPVSCEAEPGAMEGMYFSAEEKLCSSPPAEEWRPRVRRTAKKETVAGGIGGLSEELERLKKNLEHRPEETFTRAVERIMREKQLTAPKVYKRIDMDRKTFNKLINDPEHRPSKRTAMQLCVGLELTMDESRDLLEKAGYAFSPSSRMDVVVSFFLEHGEYSISEIDSVAWELAGETLFSRL